MLDVAMNLSDVHWLGGGNKHRNNCLGNRADTRLRRGRRGLLGRFSQ